MAAPITHIVLAEQILTKRLTVKNKREFYVGTSFPDVRHLSGIDRNKTHFEVSSLGEVRGEEPFMAGVKFHSLVDIAREEYMKDSGLYDLFPDSEHALQAIKIFEDKVLYNKIPDWPPIIDCFTKVYKEEVDFGVKIATINKWHALLRNYFSKPPVTNEAIKSFVKDMDRPTQMAEEAVSVLSGVSNLDKATKIVNEFYYDFNDLI